MLDVYIIKSLPKIEILLKNSALSQKIENIDLIKHMEKIIYFKHAFNPPSYFSTNPEQLLIFTDSPINPIKWMTFCVVYTLFKSPYFKLCSKLG